mgnify:CR=1 FL=1
MDNEHLKLLQQRLSPGYQNLAEQLADLGAFVDIPKDQEILRPGAYVKHVPIVLSGLVKVMTKGEMKDLLLYYIQPGESCMISFIHALDQKPSTISAIAEAPTTALLIPAQEIEPLIHDSPQFNKLFHELSNKRYTDLLTTIHEVFFNKLEDRLIKYLKNKKEMTGDSGIKLTHQEIANDLGTAREVISRTLKKLEQDERVICTSEKIQLV